MDINAVDNLDPDWRTLDRCRGCGASRAERHDPFCSVYLAMKQQQQNAPFNHRPTPVTVVDDYATVDGVLKTIKEMYVESEDQISPMATLGRLTLSLRSYEEALALNTGNNTQQSRLAQIVLCAVDSIMALRRSQS